MMPFCLLHIAGRTRCWLHGAEIKHHLGHLVNVPFNVGPPPTAKIFEAGYNNPHLSKFLNKYNSFVTNVEERMTKI